MRTKGHISFEFEIERPEPRALDTDELVEFAQRAQEAIADVLNAALPPGCKIVETPSAVAQSYATSQATSP